MSVQISMRVSKEQKERLVELSKKENKNLIEIADKVFNPVFIVELYFFASSCIGQRQADILEQKG